MTCTDCGKRAKAARQAVKVRVAQKTDCCAEHPVTRERFVAEARVWTGTPYLHQGRNRLGVDCIGLLLVVGWSLGLTEYDVKGYGRTPNAGFLEAECERLMQRTDNALTGDVYLMRFTRDPQHLAIATDRGLIHAWGGAGRVVETSLPLSWRSRIVRAYAVPGVV